MTKFAQQKVFLIAVATLSMLHHVNTVCLAQDADSRKRADSQGLACEPWVRARSPILKGDPIVVRVGVRCDHAGLQRLQTRIDRLNVSIDGIQFVDLSYDRRVQNGHVPPVREYALPRGAISIAPPSPSLCDWYLASDQTANGTTFFWPSDDLPVGTHKIGVATMIVGKTQDGESGPYHLDASASGSFEVIDSKAPDPIEFEKDALLKDAIGTIWAPGKLRIGSRYASMRLSLERPAPTNLAFEVFLRTYDGMHRLGVIFWGKGQLGEKHVFVDRPLSFEAEELNHPVEVFLKSDRSAVVRTINMFNAWKGEMLVGTVSVGGANPGLIQAGAKCASPEDP